jgi:hypothetical protein
MNIKILHKKKSFSILFYLSILINIILLYSHYFIKFDFILFLFLIIPFWIIFFIISIINFLYFIENVYSEKFISFLPLMFNILVFILISFIPINKILINYNFHSKLNEREKIIIMLRTEELKLEYEQMTYPFYKVKLPLEYKNLSNNGIIDCYKNKDTLIVKFNIETNDPSDDAKIVYVSDSTLRIKKDENDIYSFIKIYNKNWFYFVNYNHPSPF